MSDFRETLKKNNCLAFYLAVIFLFNILFLFFPLLNVFGFEFSFINSVLMVFISGIYTIKLFLRHPEFLKNIDLTIKKLLLAFSAFLIIPVLVFLIHSFLTIICSLGDGFLFYLVITIPSVFIGSGLGLFTFAYFKKYCVISFIVIVILIISIALLEFYFNPQVYFFNPVFGYFPGTIYDEGIKISEKLIIYRIINLLFFAGLFFFIFRLMKEEQLRFKKQLLLTTIIVAGLFIFFSPQFGFSTTNQKLRQELKKHFETEHFQIYYAAEIPDQLAEKITVEHEYYFYQLRNFFGLTPKHKIISYVFYSNDQKGKLFGSANADVSKPWLHQIYISADSYVQTLKHELAHVFTAGFGTGIFKVADGLNPALIEGAAVAADPVYDDNTIHFMAALAYKNNYKINVERLFKGLNFFSKVSSLSYIYAGSFSKFLIDKYGIEKFEKFYSDMDFSAIYNLPIGQVVDEYYNFLDSVKVGQNIDKANYYFGRQTIFQKVCPRYVAERLKIAGDYFSKKKYIEAKKNFEEILKTTNSYSALAGISTVLVKTGRKSEAIKLLKDSISGYKNTAYYYNLELLSADLEAENSNYNSADSVYEKLVVQNPNRVLFNLAELRLNLLKDTLIIKKYLTGSDSTKFAILKNLNAKNYVYCSFPALINLSQITKADNKDFFSLFDKIFRVTDYESSYAVYKLSQFMMDNMNLIKARELAALSLQYQGDENFSEILKANFKKADWLYYKADSILLSLRYSK